MWSPAVQSRLHQVVPQLQLLLHQKQFLLTDLRLGQHKNHRWDGNVRHSNEYWDSVEGDHSLRECEMGQCRGRFTLYFPFKDFIQ